MSIYRTALPIVLLLTLSSCSSGQKRPVFYPNAHSQSLSKAQRERDIDACMVRARDAGVNENRDGEIGKKVATGALIGGVASSAWGLVYGDGDAGKRALAGAVAGGAAGGVKGAVDSTEPNPTFKRFVQRCLSEHGYDVIGWE